MDKKINVLIFPAGEQNSLELHDALSGIVNLTVFGASSIERHGEFVFENYINSLPMINHSNFISVFNEIIRKNKIDIIFPTHDDVITFFAEKKELINAFVIMGDGKTVDICRHKKLISKTFSDCDFNPITYESNDNIADYPVFIKPDVGQGSVGAKKIENSREIKAIDFNTYLVSEYLPGKELTIDCITDKNGNLKYVSPRSRERILAGICVRGRNESLTNEIQEIAEIINERLSFLGAWNFQIKKDKLGKYKLLELSSKIATSSCLTRALGVNLPLLSVYTVLGYDIDILKPKYNILMERALISRYKIDYEYDTVYFDFDDTIIINKKVNLTAIQFLYQCKNKHKQIILLTKHENDLKKNMKDYCIDENLFDEIIHIDINACKENYINHLKSIFIDNSYKEREKVYNNLNIPVFDVNGIEVLLDWKC